MAETRANADGTESILTVERGEGETRVLRLQGRIAFENLDRLSRETEREIERIDPSSSVALDLERTEASDSAPVILVLRIRRWCKAREIPIAEERLDRATRTLLTLASDDPIAGRFAPPPPAAGSVATIGEFVLEWFREALNIVGFIGRVVLSLLWSLRRPWSVRWEQVFLLTKRAGTDALPIVVLLSALVGLVTAFSAAVQLREFGANIYIANLTGIGMTRELGPLLAAILVVGRSGSAFAAEIGTMKIADEIDALEVMRIPPLEYLVMPRILAVMLSLPLLTLFADTAGIAGGMLIAITDLDLTTGAFLRQLDKAIGLWDVFSGVLKAFFFGILIAGVGCYHGMSTGGGALGVGRSTTASVVHGIFLLIVADSIFVVVFHYLGLGGMS
ncbi:MAG: MlaE family lipid ABC transporter permease subunit [Candidatus Eisenbacteria bacterium]|nr:MlaE family lipid ABC transporter permease subunit [Candidatus Latescibacterota bacterium]MBD3303410.1 MlaE family lipid ABC transporter permease subunit [Candidatus Eisenbacteria bacterium]